jgi:hypothetical protein
MTVSNPDGCTPRDAIAHEADGPSLSKMLEQKVRRTPLRNHLSVTLRGKLRKFVEDHD